MTRHYRTPRHVRAHLRHGRRLWRAWAWLLPGLWLPPGLGPPQRPGAAVRRWAAVWLPRAVDCLVTALVVAGFFLVLVGLELADAWRRTRRRFTVS